MTSYRFSVAFTFSTLTLRVPVPGILLLFFMPDLMTTDLSLDFPPFMILTGRLPEEAEAAAFFACSYFLAAKSSSVALSASGSAQQDI